MKRVYFVRHGEATHNVRANPLYEGQASSLTEKGWEQARKIADRATKIPVEVLVSSTMLRAQQTASVLGTAIQKDIELSELFVEHKDPTSLIGLVWEDPETQQHFQSWQETLFASGTKFRDGENFDEMVARAKAAIAYLEAKPEMSIMVVTHGMFLRVLVCLVTLGDSFTPEIFKRIYKTMMTTNTGITLLEYDPEKTPSWCLRAWNDHAHLG